MADSHRPAVAVTITLNPVYRGAGGGLTPLPEEG